MSTTDPPARRWNLFARELEDMLASRGLRLSQLDDRAGIHREKVRRLRRSLRVPKSFPTLNAEEMEQARLRLGLREDEMLRLRAAILATAVEDFLMDRLPRHEDALLAAEQLLPTLRAALEAHEGEPAGIGSFTRAPGGTIVSEDEQEEALEAALGGALEAIDRATLALHLSAHVATPAERLAQVRRARDGFHEALAALARAELSVKAMPAWGAWQAEAAGGLTAAEARLRDLAE
jgi:hypothetical protein